MRPLLFSMAMMLASPQSSGSEATGRIRGKGEQCRSRMPARSLWLEGSL